jgi:hypothetical protein
VPELPSGVRGGVGRFGGIVGYPLDLLRREVAYLAVHVHWSYEAVMGMPHWERRYWLREVAALGGEAAGEGVLG